MQTVKTYLESRGLRTDALPADLQEYSAVENFTTGRRHPAMMAAVRDVAGELVALHCTFLTSEGMKISGDDVKARLFLGPCKGGAIRLASAVKRVALAEGVEDALSIIQTTDWPCWAAGSAGNLKNIILPESIREVLICADRDPVGVRAAHELAERLTREGRKARVALPPEGFKDFNAALMAGIKETAA